MLTLSVSARALALVFATFALAFATFALPSAALAGPVEELVQVTIPRAAPNHVALRYENGGDGLLLSRDGGTSFALVCASMISATQVARRSPVAMLADGTVLMLAFDGLWQDDGHGCGFASVPAFAGTWVSDVAEHPDDPGVAYVATSGADALPHGIFERTADGTFTPVGVHEPRLLITRLLAVRLADGRLRFVETIARVPEDAAAGGALGGFVRSSDDGGQTWREFPLAGEPAPVLAAVSALHPETLLFVDARDSAPTRLLVSRDGGETLSPYLEVTKFAGVAQAPDGRVWIADAGDTTASHKPSGVWASASLEEAPVKIRDQATTCIAYRGGAGDLFACQRAELGTLSADGSEYRARTSFLDVTSFVTCPGENGAEVCAEQLCGAWCGPTHFASAPLCTAYDTPTCGPRADGAVIPPDAGSVDQDASGPADDAADASPEGTRPAASCTASGQGGWYSLVVSLAALLALCLRRSALLAFACLAACSDAASGENLEEAAAAYDDLGASACAGVPKFELDMRVQGEAAHAAAVLKAATPAQPEKYRNDWLVQLTDMQGEPLEDANITMARPFMPAHGHDGTFAPTVRAGERPGEFHLDDLNLWMRGPWEVQLRVSSARAGDDYLVFHVCIEE